MSATTVRAFTDGKLATKNAERWLRWAKKEGSVTVLGGGWWKIAGWNRPVQGFAALAIKLLGRGVINRDGTFTDRGTL